MHGAGSFPLASNNSLIDTPTSTYLCFAASQEHRSTMPKDESCAWGGTTGPGIAENAPLKRGDACLYCRKRRIRCSGELSISSDSRMRAELTCCSSYEAIMSTLYETQAGMCIRYREASLSGEAAGRQGCRIGRNAQDGSTFEQCSEQFDFRQLLLATSPQRFRLAPVQRVRPADRHQHARFALRFQRERSTWQLLPSL